MIPFQLSPVTVLNRVSMLLPKVWKLLLSSIMVQSLGPHPPSTLTSENRFIPITAYTYKFRKRMEPTFPRLGMERIRAPNMFARP